MMLLQFLVTLALLQLVQLQEESKLAVNSLFVNVPTLSGWFISHRLLIHMFTYLYMTTCPNTGVGQCACSADIRQLQDKLGRSLQEQNSTLQEITRLLTQSTIQHFPIGTFQNPAPSCKYIEQRSPSGYYWIQRPATAGYGSQVYCDMTR